MIELTSLGLFFTVFGSMLTGSFIAVYVLNYILKKIGPFK